MRRLIEGNKHFRDEDFSRRAELFKELAKAQSPETLFITCSDSRIDPNLITHSEPGDLFIVRNAGNIVPPHGLGGGESATIEFAITALGVREVIICGHSACGAMKGLLNPEILDSMPTVASWLTHAQATRAVIDQNYADETDKEALLAAATEENVLIQLGNLMTLPSVAALLAKGDLTLHGWVYKIGTGEVFAYDKGDDQFIPLEKYREPPIASAGHKPKYASR
ncbi:MAG: carbonic anhydrase [Pirellulaceae bacterium]